MDYLNLNGGPLVPLDADGFPPRRTEGPVDDTVLTEPKSEWTSYADEWWRVFVPEEYRQFWRPKGAQPIATDVLIEITPTGSARRALIENVAPDIHADIGDFYHVKGGGGQNLTEQDHYAQQTLRLERVGDKIAIVSVLKRNNKKRSIGYIPDFLISPINDFCDDVAILGVELLEIRIHDGEQPKARYSIGFLDLRNVLPESDPIDDEDEPLARPKVSQEELDQIVSDRSAEPLPDFKPWFVFYLGGGKLRSMTLKTAAAEVTKRGGTASSTPGPVSNPDTRFMVAGTKPTKAVYEAHQLGIRIITEDEFLRMLETCPVPTSESQNSETLQFSGLIFYLTGILTNMNYAKATQLIRARGGSVEDFSTAAPDTKRRYLIAGEKAGWRVDEARKMGITVISEAEFLRMVG